MERESATTSARQPHHLSAIAELVVGELTRPVAAMHATIASRVFRYLGRVAGPVRAIHNSVAAASYAAVPVGARVLGAAADLVHRPDEGYPGTVAVANALWGDTLQETSSPLTTRATICGPEDGYSPGRDRLEPNVVVLLHGLGQTERCWLRHGPHSLYERLRRRPGVTPLLVRYNTGLSVSRNARDVSGLLEDLLNDHAGQVAAFSLVGYSMGGLVAQAALGEAGAASRWPFLLQHVVTIGAPHGGAPLARLASVASTALGVADTTRPLGDMVNRRSRGLKEMDGSHLREAVSVSGPGSGRPRHHYVAATVTNDRGHPVGAVMGDLIVRVGSATRPAVTTDNVRVVGGLRHFDLLGSDVVVDQLVEWVGGD